MIPSSCIKHNPSSPFFQNLNGIQHLVETRRFKAWFLDQYGVLHDGKRPYPGSILALEKLASNGVEMVIISNSSRRASTTIEKLRSLGFDPSLFTGVITSGELTHQCIQRRSDAWFEGLGSRCIHITWNDKEAISLEGLGVKVVERVEEAEFVLVHGTEAMSLCSGELLPISIDDLNPLLEGCAAKNIPMIVANPDFETVESSFMKPMPGMLGAKYEKLGGQVRWMGKPHKVIYEWALGMVKAGREDCVAVGDSLHHDIKGANDASIDSVFVVQGIHAHHLPPNPSPSSLRALASAHGALPSYVIPTFTW